MTNTRPIALKMMKKRRGKAKYGGSNLEGIISIQDGFSEGVERPRGLIHQSTRLRKNEGQGAVRREEGVFTSGRMASTDEGWPIS